MRHFPTSATVREGDGGPVAVGCVLAVVGFGGEGVLFLAGGEGGEAAHGVRWEGRWAGGSFWG